MRSTSSSGDRIGTVPTLVGLAPAAVRRRVRHVALAARARRVAGLAAHRRVQAQRTVRGMRVSNEVPQHCG